MSLNYSKMPTKWSIPPHTHVPFRTAICIYSHKNGRKIDGLPFNKIPTWENVAKYFADHSRFDDGVYDVAVEW